MSDLDTLIREDTVWLQGFVAGWRVGLSGNDDLFNRILQNRHREILEAKKERRAANE